MKDQKVNSDEHYNPIFYKPASYELVEDTYPLIGQVTSLFNAQDDLLSEIMIDYINPDDAEIGWILISNMQFSQKTDIWEKLLHWHIHDNEDLVYEEKIRLCEQIKKLAWELKD